MKRVFFTIFLLFIYFTPNVQAFDKIVIWGHKIHSHTHSYIHNAFYRAFKHLGYETYWLDDRDNVSNIDFSNALFITEGQVDKNIPLRDDCFYILHNCYSSKYKHLQENNRTIALQTYTNDCRKLIGLQEVVPFILYDISNRMIYMPWATDLLPHEINQMKHKIKNLKREKKVYWVGTYADGYFGNIDEVTRFKKACSENKIKFIHKNPWVQGISVEENIALIQRSYIAPAIVGTWQKKQGYIPCRIFKNISYGHFGVTNSKEVYELFDRNVIYNSDEHQLFYDAQRYIENATFEDLEKLMDFVRDNHTYLNRIKTLFDFIDKVQERG